MQKLGRETTSKEVDEILKLHDKDGDGYMDFAEFKAIFFDDQELADEQP